MAALIKAQGISKRYQMGHTIVQAVAGVDLDVERGDFWAIMGPSGSGKSTLLHLLGGLDRPTAGSLEVAGQSLEQLDENALAIYRRRFVGFIFQSFNLIPSLSALENVAFPMRFAHVPRRQRQARAQELLERVGLGDRIHHRPTEMSGGEQQRVAIARALVNGPELILADEPTGNLDSASGHSIMQLLAGLHAGGRTVLVVTHDQRMQSYVNNTTYMLDGRVVPAETFTQVPAPAAATGSG